MDPFTTVVTVGWEEALFRALNLAGTDGLLDGVMVLVTIAGAAYVLAFLAVPLWWRGHGEAAFDLLVLLGIVIVVTEAIKFAVGRPRPCDVLPGVNTIAGFGCEAQFDPAFPSGHASRAFAVAALLGLRFRWRAAAASGGFAVLVGLSRIFLGLHWPTDVLAGAGLGVALALALELISVRMSGYRRIRARVLAAIPRRRSRAA